jgi:hypothetical protein
MFTCCQWSILILSRFIFDRLEFELIDWGWGGATLLKRNILRKKKKEMKPWCSSSSEERVRTETGRCQLSLFKWNWNDSWERVFLFCC